MYLLFYFQQIRYLFFLTQLLLNLKKEICSICSTNNREKWCNHLWGRVYDGKECYFSLEEPKDAYELSFVAVPAQSRAGIIKKFEDKKKSLETIKSKNKVKEESSLNLELEIEMLDSFLFLNKNKYFEDGE